MPGIPRRVIRNRLHLELFGRPAVDPNDANGFIDTAAFTKALRDEKEYLDSRVAEIGGKNLFGGNTLDYHVGYTKGTYYKPYDYNSIRQSGGWRMWPTTTRRDRTGRR